MLKIYIFFIECLLFFCRLLVGAPQEKAQPQLSKLNINETGAVYYCPITIDQHDCRRMDLISPRKYSYDLSEICA